MTKETWKAGNMIYPLPAVMVSAADKEGNQNIITIAWTGTVCTNPAMLYISVRPERYTYHMIKETGEFVVNLTTKDLVYATDWCGVKSGRDVDKWKEMKLTPEKAEKLACALAEDMTEEITPYEPDFACEISVEDGRIASAIPQEDAKAFVSAIRLTPNGVFSRNLHMDGFVVTSSNIGVVRADEDQLVFVVSPRSSVASLQEDTKARFQTLADTFGFKAEYSGEYPGWSYAEESKIREVFVESYRELFGTDLKLEAIHAGLECGLFTEAIPGLDAIAVGPTLYDVHTPDEHVPLDSFERFYELLKDVLARLAA